MYALWQAIHYDAPFEDQTTDNTRWPLTAATDDAQTTLRPFYTDDKQATPWTSSMIQKSGSEVGPT